VRILSPRIMLIWSIKRLGEEAEHG
jgi:hypothetical protein